VKVLVVHNRSRSSSPSGEDRVVDQETAALAAAGHTVERFERLSDAIPDLPVLQKLMVPARVPWNRSVIEDLGRTIEAFEPDVVHVHNVFPLLSPAVLQACRNRAPAVVTFHNYRPLCPTGELFRDGAHCTECFGRAPLPAIRHGCFRGSSLASVPVTVASMVQRRLWRSVPSAYIFLSSAQREHFVDLKLPAERCFVKGNLVHAQPVALRGGDPIVAYAGRLDENKGIRLLMLAWDWFLANHGGPELRLLIAGAGPLEPLVRAWAEHHDSVDLLGLQDRQQCAALMARARAMVVPSVWHEAFGLVVAEAMAAGTPPLAPSHGAFPELISDGVDGALFPPGDAEALGRLLERVADDPETFDRLGRAARETHAARFAPELNVAELVTIYRFAIDHSVDGDRESRLEMGQRA
jgi:glycosyltransferase involved in cell wall biosynthesis